MPVIDPNRNRSAPPAPTVVQGAAQIRRQAEQLRTVLHRTLKQMKSILQQHGSANIKSQLNDESGAGTGAELQQILNAGKALLVLLDSQLNDDLGDIS